MLLDRLLTRASMCGVRKVFVMFLSDNTPMRKMAQRAGMLVQTVDGESHAERELPAPSAEDLGRWIVEESLSHGGYFSTLGMARWSALLDQATAAAREPAGILVP